MKFVTQIESKNPFHEKYEVNIIHWNRKFEMLQKDLIWLCFITNDALKNELKLKRKH